MKSFESPLDEPILKLKRAEPCTLVIFGATGDLTARKLIPALYNLAKEGQLPAHFACVGFARREKSNGEFRDEMKKAVSLYSRTKPIDEEVWKEFADSLFYHESNFTEDAGYETLSDLLYSLDEKRGTLGNRVFYFSTPPTYFPIIAEKLKTHGLLYEPNETNHSWSRVIIEKPFGTDLSSAIELQKHVENSMSESQVYRIDHYLGKETVQNLLVFRFSNSIFEDLWNNQHIDHIQITQAEDIGIGTRGKLWEESGSLRDIVQNHLMQILSLVAMEPPVTLEADAIHDEKVKALKAVRPIPMEQFHEHVVRGQYGPGFVDGKEVIGYRQEMNVSPSSIVETYAALKLYIDNWRWSGVPFYIRTGKHLPKKTTDISVIFKPAPGVLFTANSQPHEPNILSIRIQPNDGISLKMNCKVPGMTLPLQPVKMDFRYQSYFGVEPPEAYERLICDCMSGDSTLFARSDEVMASWRVLSPVIERWEKEPAPHFPNYPAGSWGPKSADELIERDGRKWRLL